MLKPRTKQRALGICLQVAGWSGAALLFYLVRFQGLESAAAERLFSEAPEFASRRRHKQT